MSWTDVFPVATDELVELFENSATSTEKSECEDLFAIASISNPQPARKHLVSTSLFWKADSSSDPDLPAITRHSIANAEKLGLATRFPPWETYVLPLLRIGNALGERRKDITARVYLANDLDFLIEDLARAGWEVYLMKTSSIRHNPGAMWRFLALECPSCPVTITDADRVDWILSDIARTEAAQMVGVGGWRVPYYFTGDPREGYRPMSAAQFGSIDSYPMRSLMAAFVWQNLKKVIPTFCTLEGLREAEIAGTDWPDYGFDEWFLLAVMYPRMAHNGLLTFFPWDKPTPGQFYALDIEYCTWANPKSELIKYAEPEFALGEVIRPWAKWKDESGLRVRPGTDVVKRYRKRLGAHQGIFNYVQRRELEAFPSYAGDLRSFLADSSAVVKQSHFIDLNPQLYLSAHGGELFLDRRYEDCDVVFCGNFFIKLDAEIAAWASDLGLDPHVWGEGKLLKVPKLEGPMTLWNTDFSRKLHLELSCHVQMVKTELLLRAWIDLGKARVAETTAKQMGWSVR